MATTSPDGSTCSDAALPVTCTARAPDRVRAARQARVCWAVWLKARVLAYLPGALNIHVLDHVLIRARPTQRAFRRQRGAVARDWVA